VIVIFFKHFSGNQVFSQIMDFKIFSFSRMQGNRSGSKCTVLFCTSLKRFFVKDILIFLRNTLIDQDLGVGRICSPPTIAQERRGNDKHRFVGMFLTIESKVFKPWGPRKGECNP
jgi:hypothetical protein